MFTVLLVTLCVLCSCTVQSTHLSWNQLRQNARHGTYVSSDRSIRILRLDVPTAVRNGSAIYLGCHFDLQGETLYSVKWYRNYVEFFRFLPVNIPRPGQPVKLKGAFVDARLSNSTHVFLYRTDLDSEGTYTCEVTTDSPTYATVRAEQQMKVYVLPEDKPYIEGAEMPFDVGDTINLTCVSAASRPAPIMSWFVNGHMRMTIFSKFRSPFFKFGAPFLLFMVGGTLALQQVTQVRYEVSRHNRTLGVSEEEITTRLYKPKKDIIEEYDEMKNNLDIDSWTNVRGPRPWEKDENKYIDIIQKRIKDSEDKKKETGSFWSG
ncbi:Cytochrome c oxidase assembly protein COX16 -like protein, mitochondrial [Halotydeus destructor]|nr:Cytochrome c oxidase assembly protein COX16 -like protein, mitochondrial [Halotydeus destructor]